MIDRSMTDVVLESNTNGINNNNNNNRTYIYIYIHSYIFFSKRNVTIATP